MNRLARIATITFVVCVIAVTLASRRGDAVFLGHLFKGDSGSESLSETPVSVADTSIFPTATVTPTDTPTPVPTATPSPTPTATPERRPIFANYAELEEMAPVYAQSFDVSVADAISRLEYIDPTHELNEMLYDSFQTTYAGAWIQHKPEFRVYFQFRNDTNPEAVQPLIANSPVAAVGEVRFVTFSLVELLDIQTSFTGILENLQIQFEHALNVSSNEVVVYVHSESDLIAALAVPVPSAVQIVEVDTFSQPVSDIYAGLPLQSTKGNCTAGFTVLSYNVNGIAAPPMITTAAHCICPLNATSESDCTHSLYANGTLLPLVGFRFDPIHGLPWDLSWHEISNFTARNHMQVDFGTTRDIHGIMPHYDRFGDPIRTLKGDIVCKFGNTTGYGCGVISHLRVNSGWVGVTPTIGTIVDEGDSGGPWFVGHTAYGVTIARQPALNESYYLPVDYFNNAPQGAEDLNLCILHSELNPFPPELDIALHSENPWLFFSWSDGETPCGYELHRSTSPYFTPDESSRIMRFAWDALFWWSGDVGDVSTNYYYAIRRITGINNELSSNLVGEFDFALIPGN